jgi:hypothetical protein
MAELVAWIASHEAAQVAIAGGLVWLIIWLLKKVTILPGDGADLAKVLTAVALALVAAVSAACLAHLTTGAPIDWAVIVIAMATAALSATGIHGAVRKAGSGAI